MIYTENIYNLCLLYTKKIKNKPILWFFFLMIHVGYTTSFDSSFQFVSASPPVVRQEIQDGLHDWQLTNENNTRCSGTEKNVTVPEIAAVSYFSNGKSLNATVWLSSYLRDLSSVSSLTFDMAIHIHSVYDEGPIDYHISLAWDDSSKTWVKFFDEVSSADTYKRLEENYTYPLELGQTYIDFNLDLDKITNPDEYSLFISEEISLKKGRYTCFLTDPSYRVNIPPPPVTISNSPNPLILTPGEKKIVEVQVKSPTLGFNPLIYLGANNDSNVQLRFLSNYIPLPAIHLPAIITTPLEVKVSENASIRQYSIPISASMSNPLEKFSSQTVQDIKNRTIFSPIKDNPPLAIIVKEPPNFQENFENFWNVYGGAISFVGGGFIAGGASLFIDRMRRDRKKTKPNFDDWS
jgi:hypothetical protein